LLHYWQVQVSKQFLHFSLLIDLAMRRCSCLHGLLPLHMPG
jgi:hypothetical protein